MIYILGVFFILLVAAIGLMLWEQRYVASTKEWRDRRVANFILWLALTFGIGAVVIGVLVILSQLRLFP
jgi:amino acid transporter